MSIVEEEAVTQMEDAADELSHKASLLQIYLRNCNQKGASPDESRIQDLLAAINREHVRLIQGETTLTTGKMNTGDSDAASLS